MNIENKIKQYHSSDHLIFSCQYHVIFCPKYRRKIFINPLDKSLKEIFLKIAEKYNFKIMEMEVMPDHIHLLIDCNPRFGIMECVKKLKMISAHEIVQLYPEIKSKIPSVWTRSTFISSVGSVSLETVKTYIENQKNK